MSALDRVMAALDVRVEAFAICEMAAGRRLIFEPAEATSVHYVLAGDGCMRVPGEPATVFAPDLFVVLPGGRAHSFEPTGPIVEEVAFAGFEPSSGPGAAALVRAGGEARLSVACGTVRATYGGQAGLFDGLNATLCESFADRPLGATFRTLVDELRAPAVGSRALVESLLKQALILLMRRQCGLAAPPSPWLAALADPRLARALTAMLDRPAEPFTLDGLARLAGMGRSAFAERFCAAFGQPPIDFLKHVRLGRAARLLETTDLPVKTIARDVGYDSRSYFSRAFRERYAVDPTDFRAGRTPVK